MSAHTPVLTNNTKYSVCTAMIESYTMCICEKQRKQTPVVHQFIFKQQLNILSHLRWANLENISCWTISDLHKNVMLINVNIDKDCCGILDSYQII